jgi:short-subunit dehydrogenase
MKISHTMLEIMKKEKYGNIVHVSSLTSLIAIGDNLISATSKIFLNKNSNQLHHISNDYNISIQTLCPRLIDVDFGRIGKQNFKDKAMCVKYIVKKSISCKKK